LKKVSKKGLQENYKLEEVGGKGFKVGEISKEEEIRELEEKGLSKKNQ